MRILIANKFLHPVGGTETVLFQEWQALEAAGQEVIPFGMHHPENVKSAYSEFWSPGQDYAQPTPAQLVDLIWSRKAAKQMAALIAHTRPDVAHIHNIYHQLSPSILRPLAQARIPVAMTVHDYKLVCPNYRLFTEGAPCTRCISSHPWHALLHRCQKASFTASGMVAFETALHRSLKTYRPVKRYLAPSQFVADMLATYGISPDRIRLLPHAAWAPADDLSQSDDPAANPELPFFLFAGRLEPEKGIHMLLEVARRLPHIRFGVAGAGTLENTWGTGLANIKLLGKLSSAQLARVRRRARAVLVPSIWYEVFGMSALEAMADGVPVIASAIGALPELVHHEETGLLVPPGDPGALAAAVSRLYEDPDFAARLGATGRSIAQTGYQPEQHLQALLEVYRELIAQPAG